jgi:hypothetical protein
VRIGGRAGRGTRANGSRQAGRHGRHRERPVEPGDGTRRDAAGVAASGCGHTDGAVRRLVNRGIFKYGNAGIGNDGAARLR